METAFFFPNLFDCQLCCNTTVRPCFRQGLNDVDTEGERGRKNAPEKNHLKRRWQRLLAKAGLLHVLDCVDLALGLRCRGAFLEFDDARLSPRVQFDE